MDKAEKANPHYVISFAHGRPRTWHTTPTCPRIQSAQTRNKITIKNHNQTVIRYRQLQPCKTCQPQQQH